MTIGTKGGPLEKNFFETCFYELKMIVLMKEDVFQYFQSNLTHTIGGSGGQLEKIFFAKHILSLGLL